MVWPWWVSIILGIVVTGILQLVALLFDPVTPAGRAFATLIQKAWWFPLFLFGCGASLSAIHHARQRRALAKQQSLQSLRQVPWKDFERLVAAYYRANGYVALENADDGPDGGVDLVLRKDGKRVFVQCKKYTRELVGVETVRAFFGVVVAGGADRGIFVTTSGFTPAAMEFGLAQHSIELVPGERLAQMVAEVNGVRNEKAESPMGAKPEPPIPVSSRLATGSAPCCPKCAEVMILRTAKRGASEGQQFWGCPRYPACRGTRAAAAQLAGSPSAA
jgi:restriction system protein